jgi:hypothetical protein
MRFDLRARRRSAWSATSFPDDGFAIWISDTPTTATNRVGPINQTWNVAGPTSGRGTGAVVMWSFNEPGGALDCDDGNLLTEDGDDMLYVQLYGGGHPGCSEVGYKVNMEQWINANGGTAPCGFNQMNTLDATCALDTWIGTQLILELTPDDIDTPANETRLRVLPPSSDVFAPDDVIVDLNYWGFNTIQPGDTIYVGVTAASSSHRTAVHWDHPGILAGCGYAGAIAYEIEDACREPATMNICGT